MSAQEKCSSDPDGEASNLCQKVLNVGSVSDSKAELHHEHFLSSTELPTDQKIDGGESHKCCKPVVKKRKRKRGKRKPKDTTSENAISENKICNTTSRASYSERSSDESEGNIPNEMELRVQSSKDHKSSNKPKIESINVTKENEVEVNVTEIKHDTQSVDSIKSEDATGVNIAETKHVTDSLDSSKSGDVTGVNVAETKHNTDSLDSSESEDVTGVNVAETNHDTDSLDSSESEDVTGINVAETKHDTDSLDSSKSEDVASVNVAETKRVTASLDSSKPDSNKNIQMRNDTEGNFHSRNCRCIADIPILQECSSRDTLTCIEQLNKIFTAIDIGKERREDNEVIFRTPFSENPKRNENFKNTPDGNRAIKPHSPYKGSEKTRHIQKKNEVHQDAKHSNNNNNNKYSKGNKKNAEMPKSPMHRVEKHEVLTEVVKVQHGVNKTESKFSKEQVTSKMNKNLASGCIQNDLVAEMCAEKHKIGSPKHKHSLDQPESPKAQIPFSSNMQKGGNKAIGKSAIQMDKSPNKSEISKNKTSAHDNGRTKNKKKKNLTFEDHWPSERVKEGLKQGDLIEDTIRINPKCFNEAYVAHPISGSQDILIEGIKDRNRALEGDVVALQIKPSNEWKVVKKKQTTSASLEVSNVVPTDADSSAEVVDDCQIDKETQNLSIPESCEFRDAKPQMTAKVVAITSAEHSRKCVGRLKLMKDGDKKFALFSPRDSRIPRMHIHRDKCPPTFWEDPASKEKVLYVAKICNWTSVKFANGEIIDEVGEAGDLGAEILALLRDNDLDVSPCPASFSQYYSSSISEDEIKNREDLRKECIFTIDPITAKDLDDAVSCKELENGNLEIGVHISDVTYFLTEGTPLDELVAKRATSIYFVEKVYHMLPVELCLSCSLLPGTDKLAYSVFWEITHDAKIINSRITRSVINSCAQLAYEHAQEMLENPKKQWSTDELPPIKNGYEASDLSCVVNNLLNISKLLRDKRFKEGSLRIDQTKVIVHLDSAGMPISYEEYVNKESHRLIEEFMLLANQTVAKFIYDKFPTIAFLRNHGEPHAHSLKLLQEAMEARGIHLDVSSSGALQTSLLRYAGDDFLSKSRMAVLNMLCAKTMRRAHYFCASQDPVFWHYALSVPFYTHFTSPIRRYADIMVHRLLNAALGYSPEVTWTPEFVQKIASKCNKMKYYSKMAGEQNIKLYLSMYMRLHQPVVDAVVIDVKDHSFDVTVCNIGTTVRVYVNKLNADTVFTSENQVHILTIKWKPTDEFSHTEVQIIEVFTLVKVQLKCSETELKMEATLLHPKRNH